MCQCHNIPTIRDHVLEAAREHRAIEQEDADVLVELLGRLEAFEQGIVPARAEAVAAPPAPPAPIIIRLTAGNGAETSDILRAIAKALKPSKKGRGR